MDYIIIGDMKYIPRGLPVICFDYFKSKGITQSDGNGRTYVKRFNCYDWECYIHSNSGVTLDPDGIWQ